jgi:antitoxin CcdA
MSLVAEAKALGVNISAASARGIEQAVAKARTERWLKQNSEALEASNDHAEAHGLAPQHLRRF